MSFPLDNEDIESISDSSSFLDCETMLSTEEPPHQYVWLENDEDNISSGSRRLSEVNDDFLGSPSSVIPRHLETGIDSIASNDSGQQPSQCYYSAEPQDTSGFVSTLSSDSEIMRHEEESVSVHDQTEEDQCNLNSCDSAIHNSELADERILASDELFAIFDTLEACTFLDESNTDKNLGLVDAVSRIPGMYRLLDLYKDIGSGGLVDKVIMAQDCLEDLCNTIVADSYAELTHVNYHALDEKTIQLLGVYGNRPAIRAFINELGVINEADALTILPDSDLVFDPQTNTINIQEKALRAGLYLLLWGCPDSLRGFVIHWPEPQCYSDRATSNTKKNCIMFHRYLCKLTEQQLCLLSDEDLDNFDFESDEDNQALDTCFTFEVKKTQEQKEDFQISTGFMIPVKSKPTNDEQSASIHESIQKYLKPQVVDSETKQSFITCEFIPSKMVEHNHSMTFFNMHSLQKFLETKLLAEKCYLAIDSSLPYQASKAFIECCKLFPNSPISQLDRKFRADIAQIGEEKSSQKTELKSKYGNLQSSIKVHARVVTDHILREIYPIWYQHFVGTETSSTPNDSYSQASLDEDSPSSGNSSDITRNNGNNNDESGAMLESMETADPSESMIEDVGMASGVLDENNKSFPKESSFEKSSEVLLAQDSNAINSIERKLKKIKHPKWIEQKVNFILAYDIYKEQSTESLSDVLFNKVKKSNKYSQSSGLKEWVSHFSQSFLSIFKSENKQATKNIKKARNMPDGDFVSVLFKSLNADDADDRDVRVIQTLMNSFNDILMEYCAEIVDEVAEDIEFKLKRELEKLESETTSAIERIEQEYVTEATSLLIDSYSGNGRQFKVTKLDVTRTRQTISYSEEIKQPDIVRYYLHSTYIQAADIHELERGSEKILTPQFEGNQSKQASNYFELQHEEEHLKYIYQSKNGKFLVFVASYLENTLKVYYAAASVIGRCIEENTFLKRFQIHPENAMVAVNEASQLIALYDKASAEANIYIFDEGCETLCSRYSNIQIKVWYDLQIPNISHMLFSTGSEELCFIDSNGKARIYSLIQQQILPNSMLIPDNAARVISTSDGSCMLALLEETEPLGSSLVDDSLVNSVTPNDESVAYEDSPNTSITLDEGTRKFMAYVWFWSDFGQTEKVRKLQLPPNFTSLESISTSMVGGQQIHIIGFNSEQHLYTSAYVGITLERNKWQFREKLAPSKFRGRISLTIKESLESGIFFIGEDTSFSSDMKPNGHIIFVGNRFKIEEIISDTCLRASFVSEHSWISLEKLKAFDVYHYEAPSKINNLLDCYKAMWERYPVNSFIEQESGLVTPKSDQYLRIIMNTEHIFHNPICRNYGEYFENYLQKQIRSLDNDTRKPIQKLKNEFSVDVININAIDFRNLPENWFNQYYCGRWLIKLGCLLPIQIAVAKDNQFVPLKDGVSSHDLDNQLAGGDIPTLATHCTLGWYESIFTYYCDYPVKVVSSMGSQSLGKSFLLNHLADSSFAGAATRCTEGIWLSLTPTKDENGPYLCVLLDFEGLKSIERTPQEDVLMNLFNAAISNLILFKNDFAIGRDIHDLFQRFQSGATIFDPAQNPSLFHSHMVIVIRDVPSSDRSEIVREFQSKFSQIVSKEGEDNFITKLHGSRLTILPWPMFNDPQFYTTFNSISKMLNQQKITHNNARQFLQNIKVLMCKMKICDWSSLDSNLIQIRTKSLTSYLDHAIATGTEEMDPFVEPLKNHDNGTVLSEEPMAYEHNLSVDGKVHHIELPCDSGLMLNSEESFKELSSSIRNWVNSNLFDRQKWPKSDVEWFKAYTSLIQKLVTRRRERVVSWVNQNIDKFPSENSDISTLQHNLSENLSRFESKWEICGLTCSHCNLRCLLNKFHNEDHDCCTDHQCHHACSFPDQHEPKSLVGQILCGLHAGHDEAHVCDTSVHMCGEPCALHTRRNCLKTCAKPANHKDEGHMCQSSIHYCGEPCSLRGIIQKDSTVFNCNNLCIIPSEVPHDIHKCENQNACPLSCPLGCNLTCKSRDHFHALTEDAHHFCGNEHSCPELCEANGICEIKLEPQVAEEMYSNKHGSFIYTKYTQIAHKLRCCKKIPSDEYTHSGIHQHAADSKLFHYCHNKCPNCEYFCTLPIDHPQKLHETSHGNMINTRFSAVDDEFELRSHTFNVGDSGSCFLCNMYCQELGPHTHIEYCESGPSHAMITVNKERQHIHTRLKPFPERPKDFITHKLFWSRTGFKDPYGKEKQELFARCDAFCPDEKHKDKDSNRSYCTLHMFHSPLNPANPNYANDRGYVSADGHHFDCTNPTIDKSKYHIVLCLDTSSSMYSNDFRPMLGTPLYNRLAVTFNNRLGAVLEATYRFLQSRQSTWSNEPNGRDAISVVLFNDFAQVQLKHDTSLSAQEIIDRLLSGGIATGGTNYKHAMQIASDLIQSNYDPRMPPIIIFLSDGECSIDRFFYQDLFEKLALLGHPTGLFSILFSPYDSYSSSLKELAQIANAQYRASLKSDRLKNSLGSRDNQVPCSFHKAINEVDLSQHFLRLAASLREQHPSLMQN